MDLPGYDAWKLASPDDDYACEFCGAARITGGWQPIECEGECGRNFRDPDDARDEEMDREMWGD